MTVRKTGRNRSRIIEPFRVGSQSPDVNTLARYLDDLVKTIRLRYESLEDEIDFEINRTRVLEVTEQDFTADFATSIYLLDGTVTDTFNLTDALEAKELNMVYSLREISNGGTINIVPISPSLIENAPNLVLSANSGVTITSDGDNWWIINTYP